MFLTDRRLYFKPHMFNRNTEDGTISLENIVGVKTKHSDLFSKKIDILLRNGFAESFIVNRRKEWVREIEKAIRSLEEAKGEKWYHSNMDNLNITHRSTVSFGMLFLRLVALGFAVAFVMFIFLSLQK